MKCKIKDTIFWKSSGKNTIKNLKGKIFATKKGCVQQPQSIKAEEISFQINVYKI